MKIVSCFVDPAEIRALAKAGADELYCGVAQLPSFGPQESLPDMKALGDAVRSAHAEGLKISLAVNSVTLNFDPRSEASMVELLGEADGLGVDYFIVATPAMFTLFSRLKRLRAGLHLSSLQPCFNSLTADFFIRLGIKRIILPNQLSPYEAKKLFALCRRKKIETEMFDYRFFGCSYLNGRCHMHRPEYYSATRKYKGGSMCHPDMGACGMPAPGVINLSPAWKPRLGGIIKRFSERFGCGTTPRIANAASFFDFFAGGLGYLKYGIRQDPSAQKFKKVREMRLMLDLAEELRACLPPAEARRRFIEKMSGWREPKL